jgi:hypothetical protein
MYDSKVSQGRIEATFEPPRRNPPKKIYIRFHHPEGKKIIRCEIDGKSYINFDSEKEWIVLTECPKEQIHIVAYYD